MAHGILAADKALVEDHLRNLQAKTEEFLGLVNQVRNIQPWGSSRAALLTSNAMCQGKFDQVVFEHYLSEWIVLCDQPFDQVEHPALRRLLQYVHGPQILKVPSSSTIKRRIIDLSNATIDQTRNIIEVRCCHFESAERSAHSSTFSKSKAWLVSRSMRGRLQTDTHSWPSLCIM